MQLPRAAALILASLTFATTAHAQCADGSAPPCRGATRAGPAANTVAVLYFDNLSRDSNDVYLADGITEELMSRLTQVERLQVKSRTAVRAIRGKNIGDATAIGSTLGVAQILSGSVRRNAGRLRVTVELTRTSTGNSLWARSFDRPVDDILAVQAEIAESIAVKMGGRVPDADRARMVATSTRNAAAFDHLLKGRFIASRRTAASLKESIPEILEATRLDPNFTSAWVYLSDVYSGLSSLYYRPEVGFSRDSLLALSRAALARAIALDSGSAEVLRARSTGQPPILARPLLERAVKLDPRNADAQHSLALALRHLGLDSAALAHWHRALAIDPERAIVAVNIGQQHLVMRRYSEAARWVDSALTFKPEASFYYMTHALSRLRLGDTAGARRSADAVAAHGSTRGRDEILALLAARSGDTVRARRLALAADSSLARADCQFSHECVELSFTLAGVGLADKSLDVLERVRPRDKWLAFWTSREDFDVIRQHPRFRALMTQAANAEPVP
jgi:TolB-like protein/tetratricopeptide (TPR) repeat protein